MVELIPCGCQGRCQGHIIPCGCEELEARVNEDKHIFTYGHYQYHCRKENQTIDYMFLPTGRRSAHGLWMSLVFLQWVAPSPHPTCGIRRFSPLNFEKIHMELDSPNVSSWFLNPNVASGGFWGEWISSLQMMLWVHPMDPGGPCAIPAKVERPYNIGPGKPGVP